MISSIAALCDLWRSRHARSAVLASLRPYDEALRRMGEENPRSLDDPHLIGFLLAAVSALARDASPSIGSEGIGAVQIDVCAELTGLPRSILAERILCLSLGEDGAFLLGCAEALSFHATLNAAQAEARLPLEAGTAAHEARALWDRAVERWTSDDATRQGLHA